jgi:hypothetical protein
MSRRASPFVKCPVSTGDLRERYRGRDPWPARSRVREIVRVHGRFWAEPAMRSVKAGRPAGSRTAAAAWSPPRRVQRARYRVSLKRTQRRSAFLQALCQFPSPGQSLV